MIAPEEVAEGGGVGAGAKVHQARLVVTGLIRVAKRQVGGFELSGCVATPNSSVR